MSGHTGAIVQLTFNTSGDTIYTASVDKTVGMWDSMTGERIKRMKGHTSFVNSVDCARNDRPLVVSGGDDCQIRVWDTRRRQAVTTLNNNYQVSEREEWSCILQSDSPPGHCGSIQCRPQSGGHGRYRQ